MNMQVKNYSPSFGAKFQTTKILELTTLKNIQSESISDIVPEVKALWYKPIKAFGNKGIRYYAQCIGEKITDKYPEIADATMAILEFSRKNPKAKRVDFQEFVKPIINELGETIDITI